MTSLAQGMAFDPPRRGPPLQQEDREDDEARALPQAWLESRLHGLSEDDFGGGVRIFSTSDLEAPEAFRDVWRSKKNKTHTHTQS
ncbi:unnamed protein product [Prorocentrum cordatum]|uniref:Uncharacterized protein n=1 Tax=Prorocentrum cordatum TaxID=2364126 RepID=A0ABN9TW24_9DINO|nr:unnamed protein product [Polarella glacialis]